MPAKRTQKRIYYRNLNRLVHTFSSINKWNHLVTLLILKYVFRIFSRLWNGHEMTKKSDKKQNYGAGNVCCLIFWEKRWKLVWNILLCSRIIHQNGQLEWKHFHGCKVPWNPKWKKKTNCIFQIAVNTSTMTKFEGLVRILTKTRCQYLYKQRTRNIVKRNGKSHNI